MADIGAALEVDLDITPGDLERLAMAESADEAALRTGVERSLAPKPALALAANTPLWGGIGRRIVNMEPRFGGMCMIVSVLQSSIAKDDYLHRVLDHIEYDADGVHDPRRGHHEAAGPRRQRRGEPDQLRALVAPARELSELF